MPHRLGELVATHIDERDLGGTRQQLGERAVSHGPHRRHQRRVTRRNHGTVARIAGNVDHILQRGYSLRQPQEEVERAGGGHAFVYGHRSRQGESGGFNGMRCCHNDVRFSFVTAETGGGTNLGVVGHDGHLREDHFQRLNHRRPCLFGRCRHQLARLFLEQVGRAQHSHLRGGSERLDAATSLLGRGTGIAEHPQSARNEADDPGAGQEVVGVHTSELRGAERGGLETLLHPGGPIVHGHAGVERAAHTAREQFLRELEGAL